MGRTSKSERAARGWAGIPLSGDEEVVLVAHPSAFASIPKYLYTLGFYSLWRRNDTVVVTDRRLLIGRGIVSREEHSIPMGNIDAVRFVRKGLVSYAQVTVNDRGRRRTERIGPMSSRDARRFVAEVLARQ